VVSKLLQEISNCNHKQEEEELKQGTISTQFEHSDVFSDNFKTKTQDKELLKIKFNFSYKTEFVMKPQYV
jgi:hypothetical protein